MIYIIINISEITEKVVEKSKVWK